MQGLFSLQAVKGNETYSFIDHTHRNISEGWIGLNNRVDLFFSNQTDQAVKSKSMIMAYYGAEKTEGAQLSYNFDIKIRVDLSRTAKRLKIVIEKERDDIFEATQSRADNIKNNAGGSSNEVLEQSNYIAGITYLLFDSEYFETHGDLGMKILLPLDPFMKLKFFRELTTDFMHIFISQKFILYRQEGFSEVTSLSFSKKLSSFFSLEQLNSLSWQDKNDKFALRHSLSLYQRLDDRRSWVYTLGANGEISPVFNYTSYDASLAYRKLLYGQWLFGHMTLGGEFKKERDFAMTNFIQGRIVVYFK